MKNNLELVSIFITFAFFFSSVQSKSSTPPKYETQYFMELSSTFLDSIKQDELGNAVLWHPRLTITKVHTLQDNVPSLMHSEKERSKKPNSNFVSFLQIKQTNQGTDSLTFIPGKPSLDNSALHASKMSCSCRFVKDSNPFTLIQTSKALLAANDPYSGLIQNEINSENSIENPVLLAETKVDDDDNSYVQSIKKQNRFENIESTKNLRQTNTEWNELTPIDYRAELVQKNELLKAQLENESLKEALQRERLQNERGEELFKNKISTPNINDDYLLALLKKASNGRGGGANLNNLDFNDLNEFYEFQKYQQYKSLMTMQDSNPKNSRFGNYQNYNPNIPSDYGLLERVLDSKDENLRKDLIRALIN